MRRERVGEQNNAGASWGKTFHSFIDYTHRSINEDPEFRWTTCQSMEPSPSLLAWGNPEWQVLQSHLGASLCARNLFATLEWNRATVSKLGMMLPGSTSKMRKGGMQAYPPPKMDPAQCPKPSKAVTRTQRQQIIMKTILHNMKPKEGQRSS